MFDVVALMPMRHFSSRIEGKNYKLFGDERPLFFHMASKLVECKEINKVVIDTDSEYIKELCVKNFPQIVIIDRPKSLSGEDCPMNDILLYDIQQVKSKFYIQTHSTNPLLRKASIVSSLKLFKKNFPTYDSLFSVTKMQTRLWDSMARPINHNKNILMRTQDLPPYYEENSCIYIFERECLEKNRNRIGERPFMYELNPIEASDIDEKTDFLLTETLFKMSLDKS